MKAPSSAVFSTVRYVVVPFGEEPRQFRREHEAEREARLAARRTGYADYYRVVGEIVTDIWRKPELLGGFEWVDGAVEADVA